MGQGNKSRGGKSKSKSKSKSKNRGPRSRGNPNRGGGVRRQDRGNHLDMTVEQAMKLYKRQIDEGISLEQAMRHNPAETISFHDLIQPEKKEPEKKEPTVTITPALTPDVLKGPVKNTPQSQRLKITGSGDVPSNRSTYDTPQPLVGKQRIDDGELKAGDIPSSWLDFYNRQWQGSRAADAADKKARLQNEAAERQYQYDSRDWEKKKHSGAGGAFMPRWGPSIPLPLPRRKGKRKLTTSEAAARRFERKKRRGRYFEGPLPGIAASISTMGLNL